MTRFLDSIAEAAAIAEHASVGMLAQLDFSSGFVRVTSRSHDVQAFGQTFVATGEYGAVEGIGEDTAIRPRGIRLTLSSIPNDLVTKATDDLYHGRDVALWLAFFDEAHALLGTLPIFAGFMDVLTIRRGRDSSAIEVACEHELARWQRARPLWGNQASHKQYFAGDLFFDQVDFLKDRVVRWGAERVAVPYTPAPDELVTIPG